MSKVLEKLAQKYPEEFSFENDLLKSLMEVREILSKPSTFMDLIDDSYQNSNKFKKINKRIAKKIKNKKGVK